MKLQHEYFQGAIIILCVMALFLAVYISDIKTNNALTELRQEVEEACPELITGKQTWKPNITTIVNESALHWPYKKNS